MISNTLKSIHSLNIKIKFVIIAVQNTKDKNKYIFNTKKIFELLNSFDLILKSELIWKIHETDFTVIKEFIQFNSQINSDVNLLLNDKRILVFRED